MAQRPTGLWRRVIGRMSGGMVDRSPLISVVMPVCNVEKYLAEAVDSVLAQTHENLELIMVDDGSSDSTGRLADDYARRDARVRVIHTSGQGPGGARNLGIAQARGSFLTFADGDDRVHPKAYATMLASLESSGSDLVTGHVRRFDGAGAFTFNWNQRSSHQRTRTGIRLEDEPMLLLDTQTWNKLFRREFWDRLDVHFRSGYYQDQGPMTLAFWKANGIDVLDTVVYDWRSRQEKDSITQRRAELGNLRDKILAVRESLDAVADSAMLRQVIVDKAFESDLWSYAKHVGRGDTEFDGLFAEAFTSWWSDELLTRDFLSNLARPVFYAAFAAAGPDLARRALDWVLEHQRDVPTVVDGDEVYAVVDAGAGLDLVPRAAWRVTALVDLRLRVTDVRWVGRQAALTGWAFFSYLPDPVEDIDVVAVSVADPAMRVALPTERVWVDPASIRSKDRVRPQHDQGFRAWFDPALPGLADGSWTIELTARAGVRSATRVLDDVEWGTATRAVNAGTIDATTGVSVTAVNGTPVTFAVTSHAAGLSAVRLRGRHLVLDLVPDGLEVAAASIEYGRTKLTVDGSVERTPEGSVRVSFDLPSVPEDESPVWSAWRPRLHLADGRKVRPFVPDDCRIEILDAPAMTVEPQRPDGLLQVGEKPRVITVTEVHLAAGAAVRVQARVPAAGEFVLGLSSAGVRLVESAPQKAQAGDTISVDLAVPDHTGDVRLELVAREPDGRTWMVVMAPELMTALPLWRDEGGVRFDLRIGSRFVPEIRVFVELP